MAGAFVSASGLIACVDPCLDTLARAALGISGRLHLLVSDDPCPKDLFPVFDGVIKGRVGDTKQALYVSDGSHGAGL